MLERVRQMVIKEFIQVLRDRRMRVFLFLPPLVQLFVFGYVATMDVNNIPTALYDLDHSSESREVARRLVASGYFTIRTEPSSAEELRGLLDRGEVLCAVQIDHGFQKDLERGIPTQIQLIVDGTDSNTALVAQAYAAQILARYGTDRLRLSASAIAGTIDFRPRAWYNPDLRSRNYNVPGVIALIVTLMCLILTSMAIVREREAGTMEQLMVTPLKPAELILGKTIPFALISILDMLLVTAVGVFWFGIPIRGSLFLLFLGTTVYLLTVLGIGLFLSTIAKTQQQVMMAALFFFMPAILLSGFVFPIESMPVLFQYLTLLNPLRYFLVIIRGIFLKGNGIAVLWPQMAALFLLGVIVFLFSAFRFRKRLS
jgi:drug efflux transport system permease protein